MDSGVMAGLVWIFLLVITFDLWRQGGYDLVGFENDREAAGTSGFVFEAGPHWRISSSRLVGGGFDLLWPYYHMRMRM